MKAVQLNKNQLSIQSEGKIFFQSYNTVVCVIENFEDGNEPVIKITDGQPQSKTTTKYLNEFLRMHTSFDNYKQIKP